MPHQSRGTRLDFLVDPKVVHTELFLWHDSCEHEPESVIATMEKLLSPTKEAKFKLNDAVEGESFLGP